MKKAFVVNKRKPWSGFVIPIWGEKIKGKYISHIMGDRLEYDESDLIICLE